MTEHYCIFNDKPEFMPMITPQGMVELGIHEGVLFNPKLGILIRPDYYAEYLSKGFLKDMTDEAKIRADKPLLTSNYYGVLEQVIPPNLGTIRDSRVWFNWYLGFYYGRRVNKLDDRYIDHWKQVILWVYSDECPKTSNADQLLLHYSWNPAFKPTIFKEYKP